MHEGGQLSGGSPTLGHPFDRSRDIATVEVRVPNLDGPPTLPAASAPRPAAPRSAASGWSTAGVGRGSDYAELSRRVRAAGLLGRRSAYYRARIALTVGLFAVGWTVFALLGPSWWQLVVAAFLAVVFAQVGFLGHDAGHRQMFRSGRHNDLLGLLCANLLIGLSYGWWIDKHNRHHAHPNHVDQRPGHRRRRRRVHRGAGRAPAAAASARWLARHQAVLFFPMLLLEASTCTSPASGPCAHARPTAPRRVEAVLLGAHVGGYLAAVFLVLPPGAGGGVHRGPQGLFGVYLGCSFAPNHKGMPLLAAGDQLDFLRRQVLTSRNIRGGRSVDLALGGLNYQIEHHLFPSMPQPHLRRAQPLVRAYCLRHDLPYLEIHPDLLLHAGAALPARRRGQCSSARPYSRGEPLSSARTRPQRLKMVVCTR